MHLLALSAGVGFDPIRWRAVLRSGLDAFMIREKHLEARALLEVVRRVQDLAPNLPLWVNGRLDVALRAGCGCHGPETYPQEALPGLAWSRPLHHPEQFRERRHVQQLVVSPVFAVPGKGPAWGVQGLRAFLDALPVDAPRILALGGMGPANAGSLRHPRLAGLALLRGIWEAPDPAAHVETLRRAWSRS